MKRARWIVRHAPLARGAVLFLSLLLFFTPAIVAKGEYPQARDIRDSWQKITASLLMGYVEELCSEKYAGRLTGTKGFDDAAAWLAAKLAGLGLKPGGDNGTFFQEFPNPYTLVLPGAELALHVPGSDGSTREKKYGIESDFFPGSTSGCGQVAAEVVYVGFGITAPELGFDEYAGLDVQGKIVLIEVEVPVDPAKKPLEFLKWRPYSFHQYKMRNAREHGAVGVLYNYPIVNPNSDYITGLVVTSIGRKVVSDIFQGTGMDHGEAVKMIRKRLSPRSFATGKTIFMKNVTEHHSEGVGKNVIAWLPGGDPAQDDETVLFSAHLDHLGLNPTLMPGANDNASAVAVTLAVAEALVRFELRPSRPVAMSAEVLPHCELIHCGRSVAFVFFGAEEQGVRGSEYFLQNRPPALARIKAAINLDGVGRGEKLYALAAKNFPSLWRSFDRANRFLVGARVEKAFFHNRARPRLDAARFIWAGIPTISFSAGGAPELPYPVYHTANDKPGILTPAVMVDLARLLLAALIDLAACR